LGRIRKHYDTVRREIEEPLTLNLAPLQPPIAIVPIEGWDRPAEKALRFALQLSDDVIALHISTEGVDTSHLRRLWGEKVDAAARSHGVSGPRLEIVHSPYRRVREPIVDFVRRAEEDNPGRLVAVILPELAEPRWFVALLHNVEGAQLKTQLDIRGGERTFVIYVPWRLRERTGAPP
jgi:hypothetical protein